MAVLMGIRRGLVCRLIFFVFMAAALCFCGVEAGASGGKTVRVGWYDSDAFIAKTAEGKFYGYGYDYMEEIANDAGWECEYVNGSWEECVERLLSGEIDVLLPVLHSEEREEQFEFSAYEAGEQFGVITVLADNEDICFDEIEKFDGKTVGLMRGNYQNGLFESYCDRYKIDTVDKFYSNNEQQQAALESGEVDMTVTSSLRGMDNCKIVAKFSPSSFYFVTRKGNRALMDELDDALGKIRTEKLYYSEELYERYFSDSLTNISLTRDELNFVNSGVPVRITGEANWSPVSYLDAKSGAYSGIYAGILDKLTEKCGMTFEFVQAKDSADSFSLVESGEADVLCGYIQSLPAAKARGITLSRSFMQLPLAAVKRADADTLPELQTVGMLDGFGEYAYFLFERYPGAQYSYFGNTEELLNAALDGTIDGAVSDAYTLDRLFREPRYSRLEVVSASREDYPVCFGVSQSANPVIVSILNKAIAWISQEEINSIVLSNTSAAVDVGYMAILRRYSFEFITLAVLVVLAFLLVIYRFQRHTKTRLESYAFTDELTGGENWNKFQLSAHELLRRTAASRRYALAQLDVDKFKLVNDMYGFEFGDRVLREIHTALSEVKGKDELMCRMSADKFVILFQYAGEDDLLQKSETLTNAVKSVPERMNMQFQLQVGCGVYRMVERVESVKFAVDRANLAVRAVRESPAGDIAFYVDRMRDAILQQKDIEDRMNEALALGEFEVYYQPKYEMSERRIVGAEALSRWRQQDGSLMAPGCFIPVFESNGFIVKLDIYVFEQVCIGLRGELDAGVFPVPVSVNLSRANLIQPEFYMRYLTIMEKYNIPRYLIELELTENAIADNQETLIGIMNKLRDKGFLLSMDDFGSGYSSLNLLKDMPLDVLKLDREFLNDAVDSERGRDIVSSIVKMAHKLSLTVVCEGVETQRQAEFLQTIDCHVAQGFYYAKPMPLCRYEELAYGVSTEAGVL